MKPMDQETTNKIEIIRAITVSILAVGTLLALVLLAAFRDGVYGQIVQQQLPLVIGGILGVLGISVGAGAVVSIFQTKYRTQAGAATTISQNQAQAQTTIAQVQAGQNGVNGTPPPLNPPSSGTVQ